MAGIPYMVNHSGQMSKKGKTPWMEYNGEAVADSQFCIEHLKTARKLSTDVGLTSAMLAQARAFRELTEENLYCHLQLLSEAVYSAFGARISPHIVCGCGHTDIQEVNLSLVLSDRTMCHELFIVHPENIGKAIPYTGFKLWLVTKALRYVIKKEMWGHGIGRHSDEEIWDIAVKDLQALSDFLGDKRFLLGESPHEVDCAVFGLLCHIIYHMPDSRHEIYLRENLPNIVQYVERMKDRFWPDWDRRCKGGNYEEDEYILYQPTPEGGFDP